MQEEVYIYDKEVDWSVLHQGLTIPVAIQVAFRQLINEQLPRGTTKNIKLILDGNEYAAKLVNQNFDEKKYPTHNDIIQIRYEPKSKIANHIRELFSDTYHYIAEIKKNDIDHKYKKRTIPIPENLKHTVVLYTTVFDNTFLLDYIRKEEQKEMENLMRTETEEEFELNTNYSKTDLTATIQEKSKLVKIRKLDRSICDNLKLLYNFRCQITGEKFGEKYNTEVVEAHHIEYFTKSMNNNSNNILIVSPNYHRLIHKTNPNFNRKEMAFIFPNGVKEKLKLNLHL